MCNNNYYPDYLYEPYYNYPVNEFPAYGCCRNRCGCGYRNNGFARQPLHIESHQDRSHHNTHRHNYVKYKEFEQHFDNDSYSDRRHSDREFDDYPCGGRCY